MDIYIKLTEPEITQNYNVHFFNNMSTEALVVESTYEGGTLTAKIPNILLEESYAITGYINITNNTTAESLLRFRINVAAKPKPSNYVHVDTKDYLDFVEVLEECRELAGEAANSKDEAEDAATRAKTSEQQAAGSAADAEQSANDAEASKNAAAGSADSAGADAEKTAADREATGKDAADADASAKAAKQSETNAANSETEAGKSAAATDEDAKQTAADRQAVADDTAKAKEYADNAAVSAGSADKSAQEAETSKEESDYFSKLSESYAHGKTGIREGEETDNSEWYLDQWRKSGTTADELIRMIMLTNSVWTALTTDDDEVITTDDDDPIMASRNLCMGVCCK